MARPARRPGPRVHRDGPGAVESVPARAPPADARGGGLAIALVTRRPEFAGAAAPALLLLSGLAAGPPVARPGDGRADGGPDHRRRAGRGHHVDRRRSPSTPQRCSCTRRTRSCRCGPRPGSGPGTPPGTGSRLPFLVNRWGRRRVGTAEIVLRDRWRLAEGRAQVGLPSLECYPRPATQRTRVVLSRLPQRLGEHSARAPGEGAEFAGVREYVPGDRQRSINWPATTRRGRLQVNTFQAERSQDVVILVDTAWDGDDAERHVVDIALRGASRRGPGLPGRAGPGRVHHLPLPGPVAGSGARPAALLPDRRGHAHPGSRVDRRTPGSPGCPGRRCRRAR